MMIKYCFVWLLLAAPLVSWAQPTAPTRPVFRSSELLLLRYEAVRAVRPATLPIFTGLKLEKSPALHPIFLPEWRSVDLPIFCRIEHEMGKKMPLMVKFRLGSVEYVDALEGK